jgi:hypothetical protein
MLGLLRFVADSAAAVRGTISAARQRTLHEPPAHVVLSIEPRAYPQPEQFYVMEEGAPRLVTGLNRTLYVAGESRPRPWAYAFDAHLGDLAAFLRRHDIQVERLHAPAQVSAEKYRLTGIEWADEPYQNHLNATATVQTVPEQMQLPEGTYVVRMTQNAARLIGELMEPDTDDSVITWNLLDHSLPSARSLDNDERPWFLPIYRIMEPAPIRATLID